MWSIHMRKRRTLSDPFIETLRTGFLRELLAEVCADKDLNLEIRHDYINVYYKGNSLLRLRRKVGNAYRIEIDPKFRGGMDFEDLVDEPTTARFLACVPTLKARIIRAGNSSLELEYEQLLIRANNRETRNVPEYLMVDRQYILGRERFDLTGVYWGRKAGRAGQIINPCLIEVKFALNQDIKDVQHQLQRYYDAIKADAHDIALEIEDIFRQKLELGLYQQDRKRLEVMKTLTVARSIEDFQFVLVLVDYNPYSALFDPTNFKDLPFAKQVKLFYSGFAMWEPNLQSLA
jgi:hypothetical protein